MGSGARGESVAVWRRLAAAHAVDLVSEMADARLAQASREPGRECGRSAYRRDVLGFTFLPGKAAKIRIASQALRRVQVTLRRLTRRSRSQRMSDRIQCGDAGSPFFDAKSNTERPKRA